VAGRRPQETDMTTMALPKNAETAPSNKYSAFHWDDPLLLESQLTETSA
jgi:hypothetical protein